ncbi:hypothetical protein EV181_007531, partial [Coemansia sp. RSA 532]
QLTIDKAVIPAGLGLVPAYMGPLAGLQVSVRSRSMLDQTDSAELAVAIGVQHADEESSSQHIEVLRDAATPGQRVLSAVWRADRCDALRARAGMVTVQITGHAGRIAARFDFYAGTDGSTGSVAKGSTVEHAVSSGAEHVDETHVFSEMLQHREQRKHGDSESSDSSNATHPLFGRWVAEDSPAFRQTIATMEAQAMASRSQYKELTRQTGSLNDACQEFMRALTEALARVEGLA